MIARIPPTRDEPLLYWASFGSPCVGAFLPLYVDGEIPAVLTDGSLWWLFKQLLTEVERDWERAAPALRAQLDRFEAESMEGLRTEQVAVQPTAQRTAFMNATVNELQPRVRRLL
jgi:hypothetical protein